MSTKGLLPDNAQIGRVRLAVSDLSRSVSFYTSALGLSVKSKSGDLAALTAQGSSDVLVELQEIAGVKPLARGSRLGLYHFALLFPSRDILASFVEHLLDMHVNFGSSDHGVSEALYLTDPDGIQIEVYADRPRSSWTSTQGELLLTSGPLHFDQLLAIPHETWTGAPAHTILGHLHFWVGDLQQAHKFYCEGLGFDIVHSSVPGVLFISAGGYHHHVALNTLARNATPVEPADARLLSWELLLENETQVLDAKERLKRGAFPELIDPWQIRVSA